MGEGGHVNGNVCVSKLAVERSETCGLRSYFVFRTPHPSRFACHLPPLGKANIYANHLFKIPLFCIKTSIWCIKISEMPFYYFTLYSKPFFNFALYRHSDITVFITRSSVHETTKHMHKLLYVGY